MMKRTTGTLGRQRPASRKVRRPNAVSRTAPAASAAVREFHPSTPYEFLTAAVGSNAVTDSWQRGLRRLEEVFDERVASALERLGIPSAAALARLERKIDLLALELRSRKGRHKKM